MSQAEVYQVIINLEYLNIAGKQNNNLLLSHQIQNMLQIQDQNNLLEINLIKHCNQEFEKFKELGESLTEFVYQNFILTFFNGFINLDQQLQLLLIYINEGIKIFIQLSVLIIERLSTDFLQIISIKNLMKIIYKKSTSKIFEQILISQSFFIQIEQNNCINKNKQKNYDQFNENIIFNPILEQQSVIVKEDFWEILYSYIQNDQIKLKNPVLISNGMEINKLYQITQKYENILVIIETNKNEIFGWFQEMPLQNNAYNYSKQTMVFQNNTFYKQIDIQNQIHSTQDYIVVGNDGEALIIDKEFTSGKSYISDSYECNMLCSENEFKIKNVEIFSFE